MMINSEEEKNSLKESFKSSENLKEILTCLEYVNKYHTPFALYVATKDSSDSSWIFDPGTIYRMIGGEGAYDKVFDSLFTTEEERECGIIFFVLKKVGPLVSVRVGADVIDEILNELYDEL